MDSDYSTNILVVDDESDTALIYNQKFREEISSGIYHFSFCKDGVTALELIKNTPNIHILITDINIPGLDGISLINEVIQVNRLIPCIVISAYGNISLMRSAMRSGAHDFLIKPTDFNDLAETVSKASKIAHERKKNEENFHRLSAITDELDISAKLQRSILPGNTLKKGGLEIYANTTPAAEVGGDFYDFFWLDEHKLGVVIADVSGKNVSAALFMTMSRTLIKSLASFSPSPADCFTHVNQELLKENASTMFVTAIYGIIDTVEKTLTYTNAGHLPVALVNAKKEPMFLDCDSGIALGIDDSITFQNNVHHLSAGDTILLYTDGVPEANNATGNEYDYERFWQVLNDNKELPPRPLTDAIMSSIKEFTKGAAQSDDITTLCLKYRERIVIS